MSDEANNLQQQQPSRVIYVALEIYIVTAKRINVVS